MSKINNNKIKIYDVKKGEKRVNKKGVKHNFELILLISLLFIILLVPTILAACGTMIADTTLTSNGTRFTMGASGIT
jgi:hypothetical protein